MTKYLSIFKTSFKQESKTLVDAINAVISFCVIIIIFKLLWSFIYGSGGLEVINGYSQTMMIWYLIMAEMLTYSINARSVTKAFGDDIKSGRIAYQLNKPYSYYAYQIFSQSAVFVFRLIFLLPASIIIGTILLGTIENFKIAYVLPLILCIFLAVFLSCIIYGTIGLLCFFIEESTPFTWIIQKFQLIFGLFFPPEFFPSSIQTIINYSPIYAMISGPSKLLVNFSWQNFSQTLISQAVWIAFFVILDIVIFKIGSKKVNIYGG